MSNWKQYVSIKNCVTLCQILGVPQSSVLGPVFFLLYDMHRSTNQIRFGHFSDDTTVFASGSAGMDKVHATVNRELVTVNAGTRSTDFLWMLAKLHIWYIFNQKNASNIKLRDSILTKVSTVKFLGVTLDENLPFNDHVKKYNH